jgi:hypothetical protein
MSRRLTTIGVVVLCAAVAAGAAGCRRDAGMSQPGEVAALLMRVDKPLGSDLQLIGVSIALQPDRASWAIAVYSNVLRVRDPRPQLWLHAYPQGTAAYITLNPLGASLLADARVVRDVFRLDRPGAYDLYIGVTGADGSLGPAVGLGWLGAGDPDTPEYHRAYRFLQEADDSRADAMLQQTRRDYPNARLP